MSTITMPIETIERVERQLEKALKEVRALKAKKPQKAPKFWTKAQWDKAEKEADEDIKAGRVIGPFKNVKDLIKELHSQAQEISS